MRRSTFYLLTSLAIFICFITFTAGYQISVKNSNSLNLHKQHFVERTKRQIEDFGNEDFPTPSAQESEDQPSFWDRMVKMALRLFNKFIEWLNSS
ncbi:unnamed protein product, partial [Brenthis ino]